MRSALMGIPWTADELARLRDLYGTATSYQLTPQFPGRTPMAIRVMANRTGLKRRARQPSQRWTAERDAVLIAEIHAAHAERRNRRPQSIAAALGLDTGRVERRLRLLAETLSEFDYMREKPE